VETTLSCTTGSTGECTIQDVPLGRYWVVETVVPAQHDGADDRYVDLSSGAELTLCFVDRRQFTAIVLVCNEADRRLVGSTVTLNGATMQTLDAGSAGGISDEELCALLGARFENLNAGSYQAGVQVSEPAVTDACSGSGDNAGGGAPD